MNTGTGLAAEGEGVDKSRDGKMFQFPSDLEKTKGNHEMNKSIEGGVVIHITRPGNVFEILLAPVRHSGFVILQQLHGRPNLGVADVIEAVFCSERRFGDFFAALAQDGSVNICFLDETDGARTEEKLFADVFQVVFNGDADKHDIHMVKNIEKTK